MGEPLHSLYTSSNRLCVQTWRQLHVMNAPMQKNSLITENIIDTVGRLNKVVVLVIVFEELSQVTSRF